MYWRSHVLSFAAATLAAAGLAFAQIPASQSPSQGQPQPGMSRPGGNDPVRGGADPYATLPEQQAGIDPLAGDKRFVKEAAEGSLAEVDLGKLAQEKGSSEAVREFGKRMVDDHSKAADNLKQIAAKANIEVPSEPPRKAKKAREKLSRLSGAEFDRTYAKMMLKDHKSDVRDFNNEAKSGKSPDVKQFAADTLPTLQEHLKQAERLDASLRTGSAAGPK